VGEIQHRTELRATNDTSRTAWRTPQEVTSERFANARSRRDTCTVNAEAKDDALPLLALVYGSLSLEQPLRRLTEASQGICRLLWVLPFDRKDARVAIRLLKAEGEIEGDVVDASKMSPAEAAEAIRAYHPHGITCFIDETIAWTADVADLLGLPFHSRRTATALTDKFEQRKALRAYGLPTPDFWKAEEVANDDVLTEVVQKVGLPVVLKPRRGVAGKDTEPLRSREELRAAAASVASDTMLIEGYIPDPATPLTGPGSAPFASVELAVSRGSISILGVTGRTPLAAPFRETGQLFPADVAPSTRSGLIATAIDAARALEVTTGVLHVEIKPTDDGPVVIEVNGRPGGGLVHHFIKRATGVDLLQLMMRLALGGSFDLPLPESPSDVGFLFWVQPALDVHRITSVEGLERVQEIPGVEHVALPPAAAPGSPFTWRTGSLGYVAEVSGTARDHEDARRIREQVLATIVVSGE
jgi:biotin carboxylase